MKVNILWLLTLLLMIAAISEASQPGCIIMETWGEVEGKPVLLFTLTNKQGMVIKVANYGASLTYVSVPDRKNVFEPVVLGFDSLSQYTRRHPNFGSTVGRYANRIAGAAFVLNGKSYKLSANNRGSTLHGGFKGFNSQIFKVDTSYVSRDSLRVDFSYVSPDGEEGFPGTVSFKLTYILTDENEIILDYKATTDKPTVVNFTNHSYFNLSGCKVPILDEIVQIHADSITSVDSMGIPTGELLPVGGTAYDFNTPRKIGERIQEVKPGYDINYKLNLPGDGLTLAAEIYDPGSGRILHAYTTEPGMQFYTANGDLTRFKGHQGIRYGKHFGVCLEMQHFPDSPNYPQFPNVVLLPGETYNQITVYKFSLSP